VDQVYTVSVIGFNRTEQIVLNSIFALSARRTPKFVPLAPGSANPSVYLVDASSDEYINYLALKNPDRSAPSILVGDQDFGTGWPVLERPLQWARLFKAFDLAIDRLAKLTEAPAPETQAHRYSLRDFEKPETSSSAAPAPLMPAQAKTSSLHSSSAFSHAPGQTAAPAPSHVAAARAAGVPAEAMSTFASFERTIAQPTLAISTEWVLVVDDNLTVREFMANKLAPFRFNVEFADSGEKALFMCSQRHYNCVFLDVVMPGMDGYQVCKHIKGRRTVRKTNVVMLTSRSSPFDKIRGTMAGCDAYLTKPVDEDKLLGVIAKFLDVGGAAAAQPA
jgi:two-component system, cell cycle response regulator